MLINMLRKQPAQVIKLQCRTLLTLCQLIIFSQDKPSLCDVKRSGISAIAVSNNRTNQLIRPVALRTFDLHYWLNEPRKN